MKQKTTCIAFDLELLLIFKCRGVKTKLYLFQQINRQIKVFNAEIGIQILSPSNSGNPQLVKHELWFITQPSIVTT